MSKRIVLAEMLPVSRKPLDLDVSSENGSGIITVQANEWRNRIAYGVRIEATGDYSNWSTSELLTEAAYMLGN